ncbi:MAG: 3-hydroxyacyl-CoA dehydrogenase family protein [Actinomycetota bacterium]
MNATDGYRRPAIAGSGVIACGLAATATTTAKTMLLARSDASAWRAEEEATAACAKVDGADSSKLRVTTDPADLEGCDLVIESVIEETEVKAELLAFLGDAAPEADLATTTSSLSVGDLGERSGHAERVFGMHVFNPVPRMKLVELCFPDGVRDGVRERALAWCGKLGKTAVEVPDQSGFVVNRLLFPYLFDAVRMLERTGMSPGEVDSCMTLGAGHPMGPLALLDFVGLDVAQAIGDALHADSGEDAHRPPGLLVEMVGTGKLGRKSGAGFYDYD